MRSSFAAKALGNLAHIEMGQAPDSTSVHDGLERGTPFLQGNSEFGPQHPLPKLCCATPPKVCNPGDVLISVRAPVGQINVADREYCIGRGLAAIRLAGFPSRLAAHVISHSAQALHRVAQGTTFEAVNKSDLTELSVWVPPEDERAGIGHVLDTLDTAIRHTESIIGKLKQVKQGLLHDLLTRGINANGELRRPRSAAPHLYKQSPVGPVPHDWEVKRLGDFMASEITYGIVQAGPHVEDGVPYIRTGDMAGDRLNPGALLRTSRRIADSYRRSEVRVGDIVMAIRATVGKVLPVPQELDGANLTQGTARLAPNRQTDGGFLLWAIRHQRAQRSIQLEIKGTTFAEITLSALREIPLAAPTSIDEQRLIAQRIASLDGRIQSEQQQRDKLGILKTGLSDDLLTGRVRVTPLLDPATAA